MDKSRAFYKVLLALCLITLFSLCGAARAEAAEQGKVYLLVIDKLQLSDIDPATMPTLHALVEKGTIGVASNRTLKGHGSQDTSITLGAGNLARSYGQDFIAYNTEETVTNRGMTAGGLYSGLTGYPADKYSCVMVNLPEILAGMQKEKVTTVPGALGEILAQNHLTVCVLGNGDLTDDLSRNAIAIAMDAKGGVPLGDVSRETNIGNTGSFLSLETNYEAMKNKLAKYEKEADLIVIDLSDLARLESADVAFPEVLARERLNRLKKIDNFIAYTAEQMQKDKDQMWVVGPSPSRIQIEAKNNFTPVIVYGKGIQHGYLTSAATKRDYIIANTDIAPGIADFFGIKNYGVSMIGRPPISVSSNEDTFSMIGQISNSAAQVNRLRAPIVTTYVVIIILVIILILISIFMVHKLVHFFESLLVALVAAPLILLFLGKLAFPMDWMYIAAAILLTIFLTAAVQKIFRGNGFRAFLALALCMLVAVNLDLFTGGSLIQSSVLGYDPMAGARYYGVGNEYMGMLIGGSIVIAAALYERIQKRWLLLAIAVFFAFESFVIAAPTIGANSDGFLTAPFAFMVSLVLLGDMRIRPRILFGIAAVVILAILGFSYYDVHRPVELQSHVGRAVSQIMQGGWQQALIIVTRKLAMNLKLIRYTAWSRVFIAFLLVLPVLLIRPVGAMKEFRQEHPYLVKGFGGIIAGALVALLVNDSGIVAASTTSIYLAVPLLLLMLNQQRRKSGQVSKK